MAKTYFQPEVTVAQFAPMTLMLVASPAGNMELHTDIPGDQW